MRSRWLVIGLVASLALNLFLIGTGAGVVALGMRMAHEPGTGHPAAGALFWATEGLPQPDRRAMRQMLRGLRDEAKGDTDRSLALRVAAWSALADPTPDVAAIDQKLAESRQTDIAVRTRAEQQIVDYAAHLPPADRTIFAAGMRRGMGGFPAPAAAASTNSVAKQ